MFKNKDKIKGRLAIFAGRGNLPKILIAECLKNKQEFCLFLLEGEHYQNDYNQYNPITVPYGAIEKFLAIIEEKQIKEIIFIGAVNKPNFSNLKVDKTGAILLAKILANKILGDDAVLKTVLNFFATKGLKILQIDDLLDCVINKPENLTLIKPSLEQIHNIKIANKAICTFSKFDIGQAVIISQRQIIAVEAVEGTDAMIERCKTLPINYNEGGILVKMKKRNQSTKADLPTIGITTIKQCYEAKLSGIAIEAKSTLLLEKEEAIKLSNELGLFISVFK